MTQVSARGSRLRSGTGWLRLCLAALWCLAGTAQAFGQSSGPRVFFFTMESCSPCKEMEPGIRELIQRGYPVTIIDVLRQREWASRFQVSKTPTTIFVRGDQEMARHEGKLPGSSIQSWLDEQQVATSAAGNGLARSESVVAAPPGPRAVQNLAPSSQGSQSEGTRQPRTHAELAAMRATVRLRVEDESGISFGTGTVIHSHDGQSLVLTCGHLFRECQKQGVVTADVNWADDRQATVPGELLSFDSDANDVALVVIRPGFEIPPAPLATAGTKIEQGEEVFSIGCDRGAPPTIRPTAIKNNAIYDGAHKYDTVGRPVIGRSGGGLFRVNGELIGVCNAAAVKEDEGIFTAIENVYGELGRTRLTHLFAPQAVPKPEAESLVFVDQKLVSGERTTPAPSEELRQLAQQVATQSAPSVQGSRQEGRSLTPVPRINPVAVTSGAALGQLRPSPEPSPDDTEVIVLIRSRLDPTSTETLLVENPSPEWLREVRSQDQARRDSVRQGMAELRREMPQLRAETARDPVERRGQSPR